MNLPPALAPWATELRVFPPDIAEGLGPMILRLSAAIGPMAAASGRGMGEPDGYADLGTRGSYERLAASEWLLASEFPEEFDRRAAMHEHLFWQLARKEPLRSRICRVLFDSGPSQAGAPRLAHIAALVLLIRRARAAQATFTWGVAQDETRSLFSGLGEAEFWTLLNCRTQREPSATDVAAWADMLNSEEIWLVGGSRSVALANRDWSTIEIVEPFDIQSRQLSVTVRCPRFERTITLELPATEISLRLLRDPFQLRPVPKTARVMLAGAPLASNLIFDHLGTHLFGLSQSGQLLIYSLLHPRRRYSTRLSVHNAGAERVISAGRMGRFLIGVHDNGYQLAIHAYPRADLPMMGRYSPQLKTTFFENDLLPCAPADENTIIVASRRSGLIFFQTEPKQGAFPEPKGLAVGHIRNRTYYLRGSQDGSKVELLHSAKRILRGGWKTLSPAVAAHFGFSPKGVLFGFGEARGRWVIQAHGEANPRAVLHIDDVEVIGVAQFSAESEPGVLAIHANRRDILLLEQSGFERLVSTPGLIEHAVFSYSKPRLAVALSDGDVLVYSLPSHQPLFHFTPKGEA